jgi:hypothetical protein
MLRLVVVLAFLMFCCTQQSYACAPPPRPFMLGLLTAVLPHIHHALNRLLHIDQQYLI